MAEADVSTLVDLLRGRAREVPEQRAYTFLEGGEGEGARLSYAELDRRARAIASRLAETVAGGERALLLYPPGLEFVAAFFGCLYAGVTAVPAYPPASRRSLPRLRAVAGDAVPAVALTSAAHRDKFRRQTAQLPELDGVAWLTTDDLDEELAARWTPPAIGAESLAFLQYTSGSTAAPKGVMVSHGNLLHNQEAIRRAFGQSAESVIVGWLPVYHDMGLIGNVLQPLYVGATGILMSPVAFLQQPLRWLKAISRYRATTSGGPDFAYDLCVRRIGAAERAELDLSSWRVAFNGAEPVRAATLERFAAAFADCGFRRQAFYPCYGLAEATLFVTGATVAAAPRLGSFAAEALERHRVAAAEPAAGRPLVACGRAWLGQEVAIVDPETRRRCPGDRVGEIWVAGASVAQGYWRRPEISERDFRARLADPGDAGPFLRTGDLGFVAGGELYVTGRRKDLIIIRGRNHYPQDLELTAEESHPDLRPGSSAAFAVDDDRRLVVALELERRAVAAARRGAGPVVDAVRRAVTAAHEVRLHEVVLLKPGALPKTSSGKIKRHACRAAYLEGTLPAVARDALEAARLAVADAAELVREDLLALAEGDRRALLVAELGQRLAGLLEVSPERLADDRPLASLGLDSLRASELQSRLESDFGVSPSFETLLAGAGVGALAEEVLAGLETPEAAAAGEALAMAGETEGEHPVSSGQQAMWFLERLDPDSAAYNVAVAARLAGALDRAALDRALGQLVARHPALRTSFPALRGTPVQRVWPTAEAGVELAVEDGRGWDEGRLRTRLEAVAWAPFRLERRPLLRVLLIARGEAEHVLLWVVHHAVADFWSLTVLLEELGELYAAEVAGRPAALPPLALRYSDYVRWQAARLAGDEGARLEAYWRRQLAPPLPVLDLPTDRPRPPVASHRGGACGRRLDRELAERLGALAADRGVTLYMLLLAAFQTLLHRYTGEHDLVVGSPTAGRRRPQLAGLVGYFVNPVVMRGDLGGDPSFATLLARLRRPVLDAFRHQDYPFERLVERLQPVRDPSRSPIFQVMLTLQQMAHPEAGELAAFALAQEGGRLRLGGLEWHSLALAQRAAAFDLTLMAAPTAAGLALSLNYNRDLFDATTAGRLVGHFATLLAAVAEDPGERLSRLALLAPGERHQLLVDDNATAVAIPPPHGLHQLVAAQARRTPEAIAVSAAGAAGEQLSYGELERRWLRLARTLCRLGVGPGVPVALCVERGLAMVIALNAILETGGYYIPLDPSYPPARLGFMLADAFRGCPTRILVTQESLRPGIGELAGPEATVLCLDGPEPAVPDPPPATAAPAASGSNLAYVIYTSGSTGRPKGVQITHRAVVNFLHALRRRLRLGAGDRLLAVTTLSFDIAVLEIFLPLVVGGRTVLADAATAAAGSELARTLAAVGATAMQATPATWRLLVESGWRGQAGLEILCGGEALPAELAAELEPRGRRLWNLYGPTETTIWSAVGEVAAGGPVTIGRAIDNTTLYLLDRHLEPVPAGVPGEVYLGGEGLARGYLGRPALTAERFLPDPFAGGGGRLYRVGDLARRLPGGEVAILGRTDHQVKVRGFRIELGEIESALAAHPGLAETVVTAREDTPGDQRLVAYLVAAAGEELPSAGELRAALRSRLPDYMVPASFVELPALPRTPNGKVDRGLLPAPRSAAVPAAAGAALSGEVEGTLAELWCEILGVPRVGRDDNFFDLGGHSLLVTRLHHRIRERLGRDDVTVIDLFRYPTVAAQARFLAGGETPAAAGTSASGVPAAVTAVPSGDIAVIGLAGRFPGAGDPQALWRNLRAGVESIAVFSDEELAAAGVDPAAARDPDYVPARGVVDDAESFDAAFFGFSPREAEAMDPQHRLFLEGAWTALEDAGYEPPRCPGRVGVFAGVGLNTYLLHVGEELLSATGGDYQAFLGNDKDFVPTRVSYKLNLRGPSVNVQTACSTSLVAVHLACRSLLGGESDMALAGGITVRVPQTAGYRYQPGGILSADGHCRAFDARAGGTVAGNGMGIVVLKRLADALADGDRVRAVIKGSAINNDGSRKVGYTAPSVDGQAAVIREALDQAGVDPATVTYVEAHGTGTALGDPIEVAALSEVFDGVAGDRVAGERPRPCALGSIKSNIGHLDTAAGVAGLIKTVLALEHAEIPPSLHFETPNPELGLDGSRLEVCGALRPWAADPGVPRRAGVSSFGIGGTNAHVVLEQAPAPPPASASRPDQLLLLSGRTAEALEAATRHLAAALEAGDDDLADVAYTLQVGRRAFAHRRWLVAGEGAAAARALADVDPERVRTGVVRSPAQGGPEAPRVVFLFPGQGAQYVGMGRQLYATEAVFRNEVDRAAKLLEPELGVDLRTLLYPEEETAEEEAGRRLEETRFTQPALFVVEYALARLWMSWGIAPAAMIGHSVGELVAACLAGVFPLADALRLVVVRGRLMQAQPPGAMLAVALAEDELAPLLPSELSLAAVNGPAACVVSGRSAAVEAFAGALADRGTRCQPLHTSHAFHSPMMEPAVAPFVREVGELEPAAPRLPWVSNVTGTWITDAEATDPGYWGRHLRSAVRFADGLETLLAEPAVLLEVGPGRTLGTLARQQARDRTIVATLRHPRDRDSDAAFLLAALGRLWQAGVAVDWQGFYRDEQRRRVPLPTYPFERRRYWLEPRREPRAASRGPASALAKKSDVGEWFYAPVWKQSFLAAAALPNGDRAASAESWLLLADREGLGARLAERLAAAGGRVTTAAAGDGFARRDDGSFTVAPTQRSDYAALLAALDPFPAHIVHTWAAAPAAGAPEDREPESWRGFDGLVALVQAVAAHRGEDEVRLSVVTGRMRRVAAGESVLPHLSPLAGLLKVAPQEVPRLVCRTIDVAPPAAGSAEEEDLLEDLVQELGAPEVAPEVAYRAGVRWLRGWQPFSLEVPAGPPSRVRPGGVYLITGGLGGVGQVLAAGLARWAPVRLVLVDRQRDPRLPGRASLPPRDVWDDWPAEHGAEDPVSRRIAAVRELEALGAEVLALAADVTDREAMAAAVATARERFGPIRGVIHAAGLAGGAILQARGAQAAAVQAPKVAGTRVLHAVLAEEPLEFLVLCSSINAVVGGFGQADYCAANAFLDAFAWARASRRGPLVVSLNWDRWRGVGMSAANLAGALGGETGHPLLGVCVSRSHGREVYRAVFTVAEQWVLAEHRVAGRPTVPGATYLEMARAAFAGEDGERPLEIREVAFLEPLSVGEGERREVLTVIERGAGDEPASFRILSRGDGGDDGSDGWREHCRGRLAAVEAASPPAADLAEIRRRCGRELTAGDAGVEASGEFLETGRHWQSLQRILVGDGEMLAELALPAEFLGEVGELPLHPALLDIGVGFAQLLQAGNYLPLAYERLRFDRPLTGRLWSHLKLRGGGGETLHCDVALLDPEGVPRVRVDGFSMKRVSDAAVAELAQRAGVPAAGVPAAGVPAATEPAGRGPAVLEGTIEPSEGVEVLRRVLAARVPPQLVVSPRDLEAVREAYRTFDPSQAVAELDILAEHPLALHERPDLGTAYVAPSAELEEVISEVWQQLLGIDQVGVHDNFFELGGTSLLGVQVVAELKRKLDREIETVSLFEAPTVAALAKYLEPAAEEEDFAATHARASKKKAALARTRRGRRR